MNYIIHFVLIKTVWVLIGIYIVYRKTKHLTGF